MLIMKKPSKFGGLFNWFSGKKSEKTNTKGMTKKKLPPAKTTSSRHRFHSSDSADDTALELQEMAQLLPKHTKKV